ncbi:type II toxin-antitoxin system Phd/YefM family antitoxin [Candidatus Microgenomates bacterium]|nr:type II toxin-antitoxin system Phd/YefM family antitoxin [Candidatus Microgenomates bacterium]
MTKTLPITKAREQLPTLVERANRLMDEYIITVNGVPAAVLISAAEYESWKETNEILADKTLMRAIKKGEKELAEGKGLDWEEVKKSLKLQAKCIE